VQNNKGAKIKGRHMAILRSTSATTISGVDVINLPANITKDLEWGLNDLLKLDIIQNGIYRSIMITREKK